MPRRAVTRKEVLDVAAELFAARGYRATNLSLAAERLGVTRQALYHHFKSKDEILAALFEELMTKLEMRALQAHPEEDEPRFLTLLRGHADEMLKNSALAALVMHERPELLRMSWLRVEARGRAYTERFVDAYAADARSGMLMPRDPRIAVIALLGAVNGVCLWHRSAPGRGGSARATLERVEEILATGVVIGTTGTPERRRRKHTQSSARPLESSF